MGTALTGNQSLMGYENSAAADPYGTALDLSGYTDSKLCGFEVTPEFSADEVRARTVGCGVGGGLTADIQLSNFKYPLSLSGDLGFQNGADRFLAQFFGTVTNLGEQNVGDGDYKHRFLLNNTPNGRFGTFAMKTSSSDVLELPSTYVESFAISFDAVGAILSFECSILGNDAVVDGSEVNDPTILDGLVSLYKDLVSSKCSDYFRLKKINDDGADTSLSGSNQFNITSFNFSMERSLEVINEVTSAGCGKPIVNSNATGQLTIGIKEHTDNNAFSFRNWKAEDKFAFEYKLTGKAIGAGAASFLIRAPKMMLVEAPDYSVANAGINGYNLTFELMSSNNTISGFNSKAPEIEITNERSVDYLA